MSIFALVGPRGSVYVIANKVVLKALLFDEAIVEVDGIDLPEFHSVKFIADYKGEKLNGKNKARRSDRKTEHQR